MAVLGALRTNSSGTVIGIDDPMDKPNQIRRTIEMRTTTLDMLMRERLESACPPLVAELAALEEEHAAALEEVERGFESIIALYYR